MIDDPVERQPVSSLRSGANLDRLAELEEERRFLLRSLDDLEREREAGDVDDADYETLKDGYTVRAAVVLRGIQAGQSSLAPRVPRRWGRSLAVTAALVAGAIGIGFALASAFGERGSGEITGFNPAEDPRSVLASARAALTGTGMPNGQPNFVAANSLYGQAVQLEREDGVENVEGITYFGWTLALVAQQERQAGLDEDQVTNRFTAARIALRQAVALDATYADSHCFLAIVEFNFFDDAEAALPFAEVCQASDPPDDMSFIIDPFVEEIRAATSQ